MALRANIYHILFTIQTVEFEGAKMTPLQIQFNMSLNILKTAVSLRFPTRINPHVYIFGKINYFPPISVKRHEVPDKSIQHILSNVPHVINNFTFVHLEKFQSLWNKDHVCSSWNWCEKIWWKKLKFPLDYSLMYFQV